MTRLWRQRLVTSALLAIGSAPAVAALGFVASAFVAPVHWRAMFDAFVPPGMDAPDNWAVAITRIVRLFAWSAGLGVILLLVGLWRAWRDPANHG